MKRARSRRTHVFRTFFLSQNEGETSPFPSSFSCPCVAACLPPSRTSVSVWFATMYPVCSFSFLPPLAIVVCCLEEEEEEEEEESSLPSLLPLRSGWRLWSKERRGEEGSINLLSRNDCVKETETTGFVQYNTQPPPTTTTTTKLLFACCPPLIEMLKVAEEVAFNCLEESEPNQQRTLNKLPTELQCRNFVNKHQLSIQVMQKHVFNVHIFQLSFCWWLASPFFPPLISVH